VRADDLRRVDQPPGQPLLPGRVDALVHPRLTRTAFRLRQHAGRGQFPPRLAAVVPVEDVDQAHQVLEAEGGDRQVVRLELRYVDEDSVGCDRQAADIQVREDLRLRHGPLDAGVGRGTAQFHTRRLRQFIVAGAAPVTRVIVVRIARVLDNVDAARPRALAGQIVNQAADERRVRADAAVGVRVVLASRHVGLEDDLLPCQRDLQGRQDLLRSRPVVRGLHRLGHRRVADEDSPGIIEEGMDVHGPSASSSPQNQRQIQSGERRGCRPHLFDHQRCAVAIPGGRERVAAVLASPLVDCTHACLHLEVVGHIRQQIDGQERGCAVDAEAAGGREHARFGGHGHRLAVADAHGDSLRQQAGGRDDRLDPQQFRGRTGAPGRRRRRR